jgi:hypothetical protein
MSPSPLHQALRPAPSRTLSTKVSRNHFHQCAKTPTYPDASHETSASRALASSSRSAWWLAIESANIQAAATAVRLHALPPQTSCLWGKAKIIGTNARALKTNSISARSRAGRTSRIPGSMATPASMKQIPVTIAQNSPPRGIQIRDINGVVLNAGQMQQAEVD